MDPSPFGADKALADPALIELAEEGDPDEEVAVLLRADDVTDLPDGVTVIVAFGPVLSCRIQRQHLSAVHAHARIGSVKAPRLLTDEVLEMPVEERLDLTLRPS